MPEPIHFPGPPEREVALTRRVTRLERRPQTYIIVDHHKIFGDRVTTKVRNPAFQWPVGDDVMDAGLDVIAIRPYVTTTGGTCSLSLQNVDTGATLVSTSIPAGARRVYEADAIDETLNYLEWVGAPGARMAPELKVVTTAGGGTRGLGIYVFYGHDRRP